ncbi:hypothetical protein, partial [Brachyspira pilosicoli]|uniref:hypothetical protein n=1 Tax=Brachyspira pilosicoli TaxID=52584 RepID=UPI0026657F83
ELNLQIKEALKTSKDSDKKDKESSKLIKDLEGKLKALETEKRKIETQNKELNLQIKEALKTSKDSDKKDKESSKLIKDLEGKLKALETEKEKIEANNLKLNEEIKLLKEENKSSKNTIKEINDLKKKLEQSENLRKEVTEKLKNAIGQLKENKKNANKVSKEDKEKFRENLKLLKKIKKESELLDKKRAHLKKEEEKLRLIRSNIQSSAKDIASTIRNSQVNYYNNPNMPENPLDPNGTTDSLDMQENKTFDIDPATEEGIKKMAGIMCAAMDDYREQKEKESKEETITEGEERLNKASEQLEDLVESRLEDTYQNDNAQKRPFTIIDKIENSRVEINEGYNPQSAGQTIVTNNEDGTKQTITAPANQQVPNITVKVEAPKETNKLSKPETQLRPASETPTMRMKLLDDTDDYEKKLVITYGFDNMPENMYYSKYKKILRNAARISLLGNLQEGLDMFKLIRDQNIPDEYKQMIDKNIQDITYYLRGLHRVRLE